MANDTFDSHRASGMPPADSSSPFHGGEQAVQLRVGVRDAVEHAGRRMISSFMSAQHQAFFGKLSYAFLGVLDATGDPIAVPLAGHPGFLSVVDAQRLRISIGQTRHTAELEHLRVGDFVALLGIELHTRRRNRLNGRVAALDESGMVVFVDQSFGNCPKYINERTLLSTTTQPRRRNPVEPWLSTMSALVSVADTFFLATASALELSGQSNQGCDVSHRGGPVGFVEVAKSEHGVYLTFPDYAGNRMFNSLGNIAVNPRVGLLFPDFRTGRALSVQGQGEILWQPPSSDTVAERAVRVEVASAFWIEGALPVSLSD